MNSPVRLPRSYLYIPGDRPDRLAKGFSRGADAIIADLEDAVAPASKEAALEHVDVWLTDLPEADDTQVWVRVNAEGERQAAELHRLARHPRITGFVLPKVEHPGSVEAVTQLLVDLNSSARLAPMIESAASLVNIHAIAASDRVHQLHLGEMDLAADLGLHPDPDDTGGPEFLHARSLVVIASRAAHLHPPAAPVSATIDDTDNYSATTRLLKRLGFYGRDCIHPRQVGIANTVFTPTDNELTWARDILNTARNSHGAFRDTAGAMIDEAVLRRARALLTHDPNTSA